MRRTYLEPAQLFEDVHDQGIFLILGHGGCVAPDLIHDAQDVRMAGVFLKITVLVQLVDGLHGMSSSGAGTCGFRPCSTT